MAITYCYTRNNFFATNVLKSITVVLCDVDIESDLEDDFVLSLVTLILKTLTLESIDLMLHVIPSILSKSRLNLIGNFYVC